MKVAVIGAGPSGLVTLKYLINAHRYLHIKPIEARLFEAESEIGGTFAHRTYEDAELVSSKQLTTFSDFRPRVDDPDFLSALRYLEYLKEYCTEFGLWPRIALDTTVTGINRRPGGHVIAYRSGDGRLHEWECQAVAVCSGLHVTPNVPSLAGIENIPTVLHSADFKTTTQFGTNKTVMILGSGETGMDISHLAVTSPTRRTILCHRDGFLCAPKRVPDPVLFPIFGGKPDPTRLTVPVDSSSASLFDTAYVHPLLRDHTLLWNYYDFFTKSALWLISGTSHGLGQWIGGVSDERYHASKIFFNKSNKAMPYISAPYRRDSIVQRMRSSIIQIPIADTRGRQIDLAPWPSHVDSNGIVHFKDNGRPEYARMKKERVRPDVLVFATGYTQTFPFLDSQDGKPYPTAANLNVREIWKHDDPSVGFIGFVRPSFGAIPPLSELQTQLWILNLVAPEQVKPLLPEDEPHYRLKTPSDARIQYGVDHESYAHQLALDMRATPGFLEVVSAGRRCNMPGSWYKLPLVWALGANFNIKFRLKGPWKLAEAEQILVGELWDTVARRGGFFGHITLSGLPMLIFGSISLLLYLYTGLLAFIRCPFGKTKKHL